MYLKAFIFFFYFRTIGGSGGDPPPVTNHRHVSLANIATAFLTERKSSSRRQSSNRRKKRLTIQEKKTANSRHQSNTANDILGQRISLENMEGGIAAIFMMNLNSANANNKNRTTMVRIIKIFFFLSKKRLVASSIAWIISLNGVHKRTITHSFREKKRKCLAQLTFKGRRSEKVLFFFKFTEIFNEL
jgi:hypothetical protein